ncbi:hypothetical protein QBC37DRAFT_160769 [Rhypophila decipiens]|uniref:EGF-like domain-containing protein n=1 Tax=Rhypophila decipiens TaxID=261697 RepID=A0AAN6YDK4_9PEZI|nr:hypothetical protein QBC37DRAFT_160769 [Rhypophila decipiens]
MSYQDGRNMDRPPPPGSVRRARERAAAGFSEDDDEPQMARPSMTGQIRIGRPQFPTGIQTRDGQIGVSISKPTQMPQWPLQGAGLASGSSSGSEPYRPPPGRSQPPQRPPRPSRVPSILDGSKLQDPTPSFQYRPQSGRESSGGEQLSVPETPSSLSRPSTLSSVASIPDFPLPAQIPVGPPRRSVTLGPPPSARRGASSFYSNASFVSPIPEESPRSRSHTSFASSAAIPESWGTDSPGPSPNYPDAYYDGPIPEEGGPDIYLEDDAEESRLVRSASIGKRAKPTLVSAMTPRVPDRGDFAQRPAPTPMQAEPFRDGTGYVENSSSSASTLPTAKAAAVSTTLTDAIINAYSSASATDPSTPTDYQETPSPQLPAGARPYSRLSAIRRPPRLDIDAVRKAEARGSMTSLPDLIRRATRLAASLEKGLRPASRFEDFSGSEDLRREKQISLDSDKHQSGLSDMLAAFPPPAQATTNTRRSFRDSIRDQVQSWPLPLSLNRTTTGAQEPGSNANSSRSSSKPGRRCCGLPLWGFLVVLFVVLILVAAAIVIPLEFLVIRKQNASNEAQAALQQCQAQLTCANGGTNVVNQGLCSCLCTNGFTGFDCTVAGTTGCTSISLPGEGGASQGATVGNAIPRLLQQAQSNFSIPLSGTEILAKLNAGSLSCSAENALVTFDGRAVRVSDALAVVSDPTGPINVANNVINGVVFTTITVAAGASTTITLPWVAPPPTQQPAGSQDGGGAGFTTSVTTRSFATTITLPRPTTAPTYGASELPTTTSTTTTTMTMSSGEPVPTAVFAITEEVLDFARVAVLYILQEKTLSDAETAQVTLQRFFSSAKPGLSPSVDAAFNVTVGNSNSVNLVDFQVSTGGTPIGGRPTSTRIKVRMADLPNGLRFRNCGRIKRANSYTHPEAGWYSD